MMTREDRRRIDQLLQESRALRRQAERELDERLPRIEALALELARRGARRRESAIDIPTLVSISGADRGEQVTVGGYASGRMNGRK